MRKVSVRRINSETRISLVPMILCGAVCAACCLIVRYLSGDPYQAVHLYGMADYLPSLKFLSVLWFLWHFFLGVSAGYLFFGRKAKTPYAYRGGMRFLLMLGAGFLFYPCFFAVNARLLGFLFLVASLFFAIMTVADWIRICKGVGVLIGGYGVWLLYLTILGLNLLLRI